MPEDTLQRTTRPLTVVALLLAGGWILAGALFKLLQGSPALLPAFMRDLPLSLETIYPLVIGIELAVVSIAWLRPRPGWALIALQYLVFFGVLSVQIARGEESCGCMGSEVTLTPVQMLAIDGTLFTLLMLSRPWSGFGTSGLPIPAVGAIAAVLLALPWFGGRGRSVSPEDVVRDRTESAQNEVPSGIEGGATARPSDGTDGTVEPDVVLEEVDADVPVEPAPEEGTGGGSQGWTVLDPASWVGLDVFSLDITPWLGEDQVALLPQDGLWVLYRQQCDHCRDHLLELSNTEHGQRMVGLIRVPEPSDTPDNSIIVLKPQGPHVTEVELPAGVDYVLSTPADATIQGSVVIEAREDIH